MIKKVFAATIMFTSLAFAQDADTASQDKDAIRIEGIEVIGVKNTTEYITQDQMDLWGTDNLWEIMGKTTGVTQTGGSQRNESNFKLRGFDAARVPVYIDGVPQSVPYRGDADHGRILTYDLESIEVEKGFSSMLMGSNNLGGLVNLVTAKPKKEFEWSFRYTSEFDSLFNHQSNLFVTSLGTRQELYYVKATAVKFDQSHFRLSDDFKVQNDYQTGKERNDSEVDDSKLTLIAGLTPVSQADINVTYTRQRADKQAPGDVAATEPKIWDWPQWDRDTVALNAEYKANTYYGKVLAYYDRYQNRLYTERPHTIPSDYDDHAIGLKLQGGYDINAGNNVQLSAMWKQENHKGYDNVTDVYAKEVDIEEYTWSLGSEYRTKPLKSEPLTVVLGLGYDILDPQYYWTVTDGKKDIDSDDRLTALVYQTGLFYDITKNHELHLTFARKAHFPTMTERFSTRFDTVLPNPDLKPEYAYHYEFGYKGFILDRANISAAVYFTDFKDKILSETVRDPSTGYSVSHSVNKDRWQYQGIEVSGEWLYTNNLIFGGMLSYNVGESKVDDSLDTYYPETTANLYASYKPVRDFTISPKAEFVNERYTNSDREKANTLDAYTLFSCSAKLDNIYDHFYVEAAVNNIFDKNYEIREYFPMPGRVYSLTVGGKF